MGKADPDKTKEFRASTAKLADIFCSDAFGTAQGAQLDDGRWVRSEVQRLPRREGIVRIRESAR